MATDEVVDSLRAYMGLSNDEELLADLGIDFRHLILGTRKSQTIPEDIKKKHAAEGELEVSPYGVVLLKNRNFPQAHRVHGPFYQTADLDSFDWPEPDDVDGSDTVASRIESINSAGVCSVIRSDNPFKIGYFMRDYEDFMVECLLQPDFIIELLQRIAEVEFRRAENGAKAGARCAMIFGDFADQRQLMTSPATFRRVLKPVLADYVSRLRKINPDILVFLHSDGNLMDILPDLIECGFNAVHPLQPECMDNMEVKRLYGGRLTLFGGVSVQTELPGSAPDVIRAIVHERVEQLGADGGFMLAPTNTILPDVLPESIRAMYYEATLR